MSKRLVAVTAVAAFAVSAATCWAADEKPAAEKASEKSPAAGDAERRGAMFEKLDANSDGQITANEVPEEQRRLFNRLLRQGDANSDGKLSRAEFLKASGEPAAGAEANSNEPKPSEGRPDAGPGARPFAAGPVLGVAVFRALDLNGDGTLDASEIAAATASLKKLDTNSDGEISREELRQAVPPAVMESMRAGNAGAPGTPNPENAMKRLLAQYDKNNDGKFEKSELPPRMQEQFDELDRNHDGSLDEAEARAILPRLLRRMEEGNPPRLENANRPRLRPENPPEQKKIEGN